MGYTTEFRGKLTFDRPLPENLMTYLENFFTTRHHIRDENTLKQLLKDEKISISDVIPPLAEYQSNKNLGKDCIYFAMPEEKEEKIFGKKDEPYLPYAKTPWEYNFTPNDCPSLYCKYEYSRNENAIYPYNGKNHNYIGWLKWLIENIFSPGSYKLNGAIEWRGENMDDRGVITVENNNVMIHQFDI